MWFDAEKSSPEVLKYDAQLRLSPGIDDGGMERVESTDKEISDGTPRQALNRCFVSILTRLASRIPGRSPAVYL